MCHKGDGGVNTPGWEEPFVVHLLRLRVHGVLGIGPEAVGHSQPAE